jgi:G3E family GTPase
MSTVKLILVGGFLGAGKTTLLAQAASKLSAAKMRVGLITNDQAADLVDTEMLRGKGFGVNEVAGGCFCCRFDDLVNASDKLIAEYKPDVLIGEPVGSCTDLAATVVRPMNTFHGDKIRATPFTVVVDPDRLKDMLTGEATNPLSKKVLYIYGKQLEEADVIALNKSDTLSAAEITRLSEELMRRFPQAKVVPVSAVTGDGLDAWLEYVLRDGPAGQNIAEVDYDVYADGEAELGWLNASVKLSSDNPVDWKRFCLDLLKYFRVLLHEKKVEAAHVKLALNAPGTALVANLTSSSGSRFCWCRDSRHADARGETDFQRARRPIRRCCARWPRQRSATGAAVKAGSERFKPSPGRQCQCTDQEVSSVKRPLKDFVMHVRIFHDPGGLGPGRALNPRQRG